MSMDLVLSKYLIDNNKHIISGFHQLKNPDGTLSTQRIYLTKISDSERHFTTYACLNESSSKAFDHACQDSEQKTAKVKALLHSKYGSKKEILYTTKIQSIIIEGGQKTNPFEDTPTIGEPKKGFTITMKPSEFKLT